MSGIGEMLLNFFDGVFKTLDERNEQSCEKDFDNFQEHQNHIDSTSRSSLVVMQFTAEN